MKFVSWAAAFIFLLPSFVLRAQTSIRAEPGSARLAFVDGNDIRPEPGGKRLAFVDGNDIRPEPGFQRFLLLDGDNVRAKPGGIRLAFWDGTTLRREPGGERLGVLDEKDFRPEPGFKRFFHIDGPPLSRAQLTAVLYVLKPELFKLSDEAAAAKGKEMAQNAAEGTSGDQFVGERMIATHSTSGGVKRQGSVVVAQQGSFYSVTFKTADQPAWTGIGVKFTSASRDEELWAAVGPAGAVSFGLYQVKDGTLSGTWIPINAATDTSVFGFEKLTGAAQLGGVYKITAGKLPNGGVTYTGALNIDPLQQVLNDTGKCYRIRWATGTTGLGFLFEGKLAVAAGWGADYEILRLKFDKGALTGDFLSKSGAKGYYTLIK